MGPQVTAAILNFILLQKSSSPLQSDRCQTQSKLNKELKTYVFVYLAGFPVYSRNFLHATAIS